MKHDTALKLTAFGLLPAILMFAASAAEPAKKATAPSIPTNYDEAKVGEYVLPDPLRCFDGTAVTDAAAWRQKRRPEVLAAFVTQVYGRIPAGLPKPSFEVLSVDPQALAGKAVRKAITIWPLGRREGPKLDVLLYLPKEAARPVPVFCGLNFDGNHTVAYDPGVALPLVWQRGEKGADPKLVPAAEGARGKGADSWCVEKLVARGYGLATACYTDLEPDFASGWKQGLRAAASPAGAKTVFAPDDWGAIAVSAWSLSRMVDYLETDGSVDKSRIIAIGHSRLGKASLWAGASDERFAIVISNDSGEGGAALARRDFGETIQHLNTRFPHWYCANFRQYNGRAEALPVDAHLLIALMAPRPVYVASAENDRWADPRGEFLAAKQAGPVYQLFGLQGVNVEEMPRAGQPVGAAIGYHLRAGDHAITPYDWEQYLAFADRHLAGGR